MSTIIPNPQIPNPQIPNPQIPNPQIPISIIPKKKSQAPKKKIIADEK